MAPWGGDAATVLRHQAIFYWSRFDKYIKKQLLENKKPLIKEGYTFFHKNNAFLVQPQYSYGGSLFQLQIFL